MATLNLSFRVGSDKAIMAAPIVAGTIYLSLDGKIYFDKSETERILCGVSTYTKKEIEDLVGSGEGGEGASTAAHVLYSSDKLVGVENVQQALDKIIDQIGNMNGKFQYTIMPNPSTVTGIVQYIGTTDDKYTNGYFYMPKSTTEEPEEGGEPVTTYSWEQVNVQPQPEIPEVDLSKVNSKFQYDEMPDAETTSGIVQYTGETTEDYIKGYFYVSTSSTTTDEESGEEVTTYSWEQVNVQPQPETEDVDLSGLNTKFQYTEMPDAKNITGVIQYIGETTEDYIKGYFYVSKATTETVGEGDEAQEVTTYSWERIDTQPDDQALDHLNPKFQVTEMPAAAERTGLVQYLGATNEDYVFGYFYVSDRISWKQVDVQPNCDLDGVNPKFQYTEMPDPTLVTGLVQYIGETNETYTRNFFYESNGESWTQINVQPQPEGADLSGLNSKFQYTEMPEASEVTGIMVQYIGETTEDYINGYFYVAEASTSTDEESGEEVTTYSWKQVNVQPQPEIPEVDLSNVNTKFQYTEMPDPEQVKGIVQYMGETTESYTKGYFYVSTERSIIDENDETVYSYSWERINVQPEPEKEDLSGLNTKFQYTEMPDATTMNAMVQYMGETTEDYVFGYFYYSDGLEDSTWVQIDIQPEPEVDLSSVNSKFQYTEMPEASADIKGLIQYIGETTEDFIKGHFYECKTTYSINPETGETSSTSEWLTVDLSKETDLSGLNSKFQYTEMPDPTDHVGIVQYIGITDDDYTHGFFYEPYVVDESTTVWSVVSIQPSDKAADASSVYFTEAVPVTETIGGIEAGTVFDGSVNVQEVFKRLFYKYTPPKASITIDPSPENYMTGINIESLTVNIKTIKTVDPITSIEFTKTVEGSEPEIILSENSTDNPSISAGCTFQEIIENINTNTTLTVKVSDGKETNTVSKTIKFVDPVFWGVLGTNVVTEEIATSSLDRKLMTSSSDTIVVSASNEYIVYMTTKTVTSILDKNGFDNMDSFVMNTVIINDVPYNCYVSSTTVTCTDFSYKFIF